MSLDTHAFVKTLTAAGMPESQAEAVTDLVRQARESELAELATKSDLARVQTGLQANMSEMEGRLLVAIADSKSELLKWTIGMVGGAVVLNAMTGVGGMIALLRMAGH